MNEEIVDKNAITNPIIEIGFNAEGHYRIRAKMNPWQLACELERWRQRVLAGIPAPDNPAMIVGATSLPDFMKNGER